MTTPHTEIRERITTWLADHPGEHRTSVVAEGIGMTTVQVGPILSSMRRRGTVGARRVPGGFLYRQADVVQS